MIRIINDRRTDAGIHITDDLVERGDRTAPYDSFANDFPFDFFPADFNAGRIFMAKLRESYDYAVQLVGGEIRDATEGWRIKLRSLMAARNMTACEAYRRLTVKLAEKNMLQPSVLMMIRAATYVIFLNDYNAAAIGAGPREGRPDQNAIEACDSPRKTLKRCP